MYPSGKEHGEERGGKEEGGSTKTRKVKLSVCDIQSEPIRFSFSDSFASEPQLKALYWCEGLHKTPITVPVVILLDLISLAAAGQALASCISFFIFLCGFLRPACSSRYLVLSQLKGRGMESSPKDRMKAVSAGGLARWTREISGLKS